jgi:outer membrane protein assembly factor BamA
VNAGVVRVDEEFENPEVELLVRERAAQLGVPYFLHKGTVVPFGLSLVSETTRFREFGPLSGHTYSLGVQYSPSFGGALSRTTLDGDVRKYFRIGGGAVFAARLRGFHSSGDQPDVFYFGGNMELRGYPYLGFAGNKGFFANLEFRFPLIDLMKTPLGILGPVRGTLFAGMGGAHFKGEPWEFASSDPGRSYVNDPVFGEPVDGFHLVDGRASFGIGLQFFFLGYPLHFDWSKLTDLKVTSNNTRFDFWVGFDF